MSNNKSLISGLKLNGISDEVIEKILELKAIAEKLGWEMDDYDGMDGNIYTTFSIPHK